MMELIKCFGIAAMMVAAFILAVVMLLIGSQILVLTVMMLARFALG